MRYANTESEIREKIEAHEKFMRDVISREHSALKKGRKEGKEEVATNLIKNSSLNDEQISSATGFTLEEIREIRGKA